MNLFVNKPNATPETKPEIRIGMPMYLAPFPRKSLATYIWAKLLDNAPITQILTIETLSFNKLKTTNIINPLANEPVMEYRKIQLNSVPVIIELPRDFIKIKIKVSFGVRIIKDNRIGKLAKPILINGIGLGITNSKIEQKSDRAPSIAIVSCFLVCNCIYFITLFFNS